jgi:hypothetical protein
MSIGLEGLAVVVALVLIVGLVAAVVWRTIRR